MSMYDLKVDSHVATAEELKTFFNGWTCVAEKLYWMTLAVFASFVFLTPFYQSSTSIIHYSKSIWTADVLCLCIRQVLVIDITGSYFSVQHIAVVVIVAQP